MPYLQPRTNNYFGLMPYDAQPGGVIQTNPYVVSSSEVAIQIGDVLVFTSIDTVRPITGTFSSMVMGVAAQNLGANAGTTGSTGTSFNGPLSSQMCLVYDSPIQLFVSCDTTSFTMGSTAIYKNVAILATGPALAISTAPGRSIMAISGSAGSTSAILPFKLMGLHPIESGFYSTDAGGAGVAASVRKYILRPNNHAFAQGTGQTGVITT